ncbi:MlaD family protein [Verminephrobacter aporrectodeae]|uniref:MCE family protein n=1 Tax=Verminephrobacter aporrectodeae subsp. tuberculatae TaxID=1110392 RepID=A0ABT3KPG1_9BURK|nr:MlaD family protein [Verminephrobacter aporrectodeae]MCW5220862.1 MCE family protein [Verminephrobacter aporrectodeae subsp. tuberculatae]MCW5255175.1 MCE family protein [Verminephrobacter aporrectodeae subsp. tuberculatae]MCW5290157.1 MCE family protein [Verminephrobacter aporrectodeae subsp. tuberculatae]MCW5320193.1 MCE family protein [Verminephrobacter aporrectodeae subsp. tuberculatae]MCW8164124.1 MCE family protein [Verminephrobacter aporrectodeae subsp. tuberculatae]
MENKSHALAAGIFVLLVSALLVGLTVWLTRDVAAYVHYEISTEDGVSGLQPQAAVRYKGVAVGKVTHIGFDPKVSGNVLIRIAVDKQAPIGLNTYAMLGYQGVTGLSHVLLDDADKPYPALPPGPGDLPRLRLKPSPFGRLAEQAPDTLSQVAEAASRLNEMLGDENQQRLRTALERIGQAAGSVDTLTRRLDASVTQGLDPALAALPPLAGDVRQTLETLQQAAASVSTLTADLGRTRQRLDAEGGAIDQISVGARSLARAAEQLSTSTLPRVGRAADATARAARQIGHAAGGIGDNPQILLRGTGHVPPGPGEPGFAQP